MKYNTVLPLQDQCIRFANVTIYIRNGRIVVRQRYNDTGKNILTPERLANMVRWANVLNEYRVLSGLLSSMFNDRKQFQTACNAFISKNFRNSKVCLTKWEASLGACVFEPGLVVSFGDVEKVAPVEVTLKDNQLVSDILLTDDCVIDQNTTVAQFTNQLTYCNPLKFSDGDTLFFLRCTQGYNQQMGIPVGEGAWFRCDLNSKDHRRLREIVGTDGFEAATVDGRKRLVAYSDSDSMGTWIHGAKVKGRFYSSFQYLVGSNERRDDYISLAAKTKAMQSYGNANRIDLLNPATPIPSWSQVNGSHATLPDPESGSGNTGPTAQATLTVQVSGGHGTVSPESATVAKGETVTFTAHPDSGYEPVWPGGSNALTYTATASETKTITVSFRLKQGGGGIDMLNNGQPETR